MFNNKLLSAKEQIEYLYDVISESKSFDKDKAKITLSCSFRSVAMFNAIASRFSVTRFYLLESVLDSVAYEMFASLSEADREIISLIADEEIKQLVAEKNIKFYCDYWHPSSVNKSMGFGEQG